MVLGGEGNGDILLFAGFRTDQLLFKSGNECTRTENQRLILCRAAVKLHAVHGTAVIEQETIAVFRCAIHIGKPRLLFTLVLKRFIDVLIRHFQVGFRDGYALILTERYVRLQLNDRNELNAVRTDFVDIERGLIDRDQIVLGNRRVVCSSPDCVKRILIKYTFAVRFFNDFARGLALAETGDRITARSFMVRGVNRFLKHVAGDCNRQLRFLAFQHLKLCHFVSPSLY